MKITNINKRINKQEVSFTSGSLLKAMLIFAAPYMLGILLQNLYGAVDLFVVGHYAATADVSAVTIGSQLMTIVTQLIIGFAAGITIMVGQSFGAQNERELSRTTGASIMLFSSAAVILTLLYLILHEILVALMQTPTEAVLATEQYLFVCALGIPFIIGYNVVTGILTGIGDSKTPFLFVTIACMINIIMDVILVKYVGLGALGAAVATTLAQAGSFIFSILFLRRKGLGFSLLKEDIRFDRLQTGRIVKIGGPIAIQNVLVNASFLFVTAIINQMGLIASAAVGVVEKLITFIFVPATALGTAVSTASSQNLGARQYQRVRKSMWCGIAMALAPSVLIVVFCQFAGELLTGILTNDSAVVLMAADYLHSYILDVIMVSFIFCMNGYFNSRGKSWFSLLHSLVTTFAVRIPVAYGLSRLTDTSLFMIGWAAPLSTLLSLVMCMIFLICEKQEQSIVPYKESVPKYHNSQHRVVITISREYGSGGRLIGEQVAKQLGIAFYNRNLIDMTAQRSGLAEEYIANWEEQVSSRFIWVPLINTRTGSGTQLSGYYSNENKMFTTQSNIIRELAETSCVIVGRCADYILREYPDCINVFIRADKRQRVERLINDYDVQPDKAEETINNTDRGRANYYKHYTNIRWGDNDHYHLVIDSGRFGIEQTAALVVQSILSLYPEMTSQRAVVEE